MRILFLILWSLCFIVSSCSDEVNREVKETYPSGKEKLVIYLKDTLVVKEELFYETGRVKSRTIFDDSLRQFGWDEKNSLIEKGVFDLNRAEGKIFRYENNIKVLELTYKEGMIDGMLDYYPNGNKKLYSRKGPTSTKGEFTEWYEDGGVKVEIDEHGKTEVFYKSGQLKSLTWQKPEKQDKVTQQWWDESGNLVKEEFWEKGVLLETRV